VPDRPLPGRSLVTRRAVVDIVRSAVVTSYGVIGVDARPLERLLGRLGLREPGIRVRLHRGLEIDLHLTVASGLPIAEVARQVDSAVRYAIHRSIGQDVRRLTVHVDGLRYHPASVPPPRDAPRDAPSAERVTAAADASSGDEPSADGDDAETGREGHGTGPAAAPAAAARRRRRPRRAAGVDRVDGA
jgi:uncharacterized alkaline shock family protein YloU